MLPTMNALEEAKRKLKNGADYLDILKFLKEQGLDEKARRNIFEELDLVRKSQTTNKVPISLEKLVIGLPLSILGTYLIFTGQFSWRGIIFPLILMMVGGIVSLVEISKIINNILRK